jgi:hypothetical protein
MHIRFEINNHLEQDTEHLPPISGQKNKGAVSTLVLGIIATYELFMASQAQVNRTPGMVSR